MQNPSEKEILKQLVSLTVQIAESLAPLVQATERNPSPFGDYVPAPTPTQRAIELLSKATELRQLYSEDESQTNPVLGA